ncbi:MAG TPA: osmotically inducible protein OsmC [Planctomycetes bacterium]|nr:osmotically inducible protein OsmC [Planctomycetota bacterium]
MVRIDIAYKGQLHCEAVHGPSGDTVETDAPKDNMGKGEAFSPTDLVATAFGSCVLTIMGIVAGRRGLDLAGAHATVVKEMVSAPVRRIGRLTLEMHLPSAIGEEDRAFFRRAAETCPVLKSLHPDVETPIAFHWDV